MMSTTNPRSRAAFAPGGLSDTAEAGLDRAGRRLGQHLNGAALQLPHDITERLRFARERALAVHRQVHAAAALPQSAPALLVAGGRQTAAGGPSMWWRLVSVVPLAVLAAGLVFIQQHHEHQQISVAAEIDSALLADELPPAAYIDPGFGEFLRESGDR